MQSLFSIIYLTFIVIGLGYLPGLSVCARAAQPEVALKRMGVLIKVEDLSASGKSALTLTRLNGVSSNSGVDLSAVETFSLGNPGRVVVDIPTHIEETAKNIDVEQGVISAIRVGQHPGKTRVVIDLKRGEQPTVSIAGIDKRKVQIYFHYGLKKALDLEPALETPKLIAVRSNVKSEVATIAPRMAPPLPVKPLKQAPEQTMEVARRAPVVTAKSIAEQLPEKKVPMLRPVTSIKPVQPARAVKPEAPEPVAVTPKTQVVAQQLERPLVTKSKEVSRTAKTSVRAYTMKNEKVELVEIKGKRGLSKTRAATVKVKPEDTGKDPAGDDTSPVEELYVGKAVKEFVAKIDQEDAQVSATHAIADQASARLELPMPAEKLFSPEEVAGPDLDLEDLYRAPAADQEFISQSLLNLIAIVLSLAALAFLFLRRYANRLYGAGIADGFAVQIAAGPTIQQHYDVLGCNASDTDEDVKARYKHLVKIFHSDKLNEHDLPEELLRVTDDQFQKVKEAYEAIRAQRGI